MGGKNEKNEKEEKEEKEKRRQKTKEVTGVLQRRSVVYFFLNV